MTGTNGSVYADQPAICLSHHRVYDGTNVQPTGRSKPYEFRFCWIEKEMIASHACLYSFYTDCQTAKKLSGICRKCVTIHLKVICICMRTEALQTLICVHVARPRQCFTLSNPVPWQKLMAAYLSYTLRMKSEDTVSWLTSSGSWHVYEKQIITKLCSVSASSPG